MMPWDAFCEEHFEEALQFVEEEYSDWCVTTADGLTRNDFDDEEEFEDYVCGHPECNKRPWKEIIWFEHTKDTRLRSGKLDIDKLVEEFIHDDAELEG